MVEFCFKHVMVTILCFECLKMANGQKVKVIEFTDENPTIFPVVNSSHSKTSPEMSFCFRVLPRFTRNFVLIETEQLKFTVRGVDKRYFVTISYTPFGNAAGKFGRMYKFCQPFMTGKWFSICLGMKFNEKGQQIKSFVDGKKCEDQTFKMDQVGLFYYGDQPDIKDL